MSDNRKNAAPAPPSGQRRSKRLQTITCVAGAGAATVGLVYVLIGKARTIDLVLIVGGLLVVLAGLTIMRGRDK